MLLKLNQIAKIKRLRAQGKPAYYSFKGQYDYIKKGKWNSLPEERREYNKELRADAKKQGLPFKNYMRSVKMASGMFVDPMTQFRAVYTPGNNTVAINKRSLRDEQKGVDVIPRPNESDKEKLRRHMKFKHGALAHELTHKAQFDYLSKKFGKDSPEYKRAAERARSLTPDSKINPNYYKNPMEYHAYMNGGNVKSLRDRSFSKLSDQHKRDLDVMATKNDKDYENHINKHTDLYNSPGKEKAEIIRKASKRHLPYLALKQSGLSDEDIDKVVDRIERLKKTNKIN